MSDKTRRQFLQAFGITTAAGLAGCSQQLEPADSSSEDRSTGEPQTGQDSGTSGGSESGEDQANDSNDENDIYQINELEQALQQYETNQATLNFQPKNPDAEYSESNVFTEFNGDINVELDLSQAQQQRWINNRASEHPAVQTFVEVITEYDQEQMQQIHQDYIKKAGGENLFGLQETINKELYTDQTKDLDERVADSGVLDLWYKIEFLNFDGISSANNQFQMQALHNAFQQIEQKHGFNTFTWDNGIPGHGLGAAIENPTRKPENTDQQQTYIIETVDSYKQQITQWEISKYSPNGKKTGLKPAGHPAANTDRREKGFYTRTSIGAWEGKFEGRTEPSSELVDGFLEFFRDPENSPAYDHLDPMLAAAYTLEENPELSVELGDELTIK